MKRGSNRAWPRRIVEIPSSRVDPRADPQATQKISKDELEAALVRTKSGTRVATRSQPLAREPLGEQAPEGEPEEPAFVEPRDDSPQAPRVAIEANVTIEPAAPPPSSRPSRPSRPSAPVASLSPLTPLDISLVSPAARRSGSRSAMQRIRATPRTAFIAGVVAAAFVVLVALLAFFAGRSTVH